MTQQERSEQIMLIEWAELMQRRIPALKWLYHVPNGGKRDPSTGALLKKMGVKAGVPDLCLPVPVGRYHGLYIELKIGKGRPSDRQREWIAHLFEAGYAVHICYGFKEAAKVILDYLGVRHGNGV